ncbi:Hypothetical protein, putative [Bodo saltans]|uniref:Uncharacterized protein n=1 Tax=Bodo saltans TaxID=75058 RepID=A0A0S4IN29_BODSA|nr:Hypothetical protein, putative [Bodo saltans]|eukprot:CUE73433.1 Hypothetical protein, putative [Bodo saltans]
MSFIHLNTLVMQPPPHVEDDNNSTMMTASGSSSDDWLLEGLDAKRPPSWARIGLFGSHRSGKELFVASVAGMSSSSSKVSPLPQTSAHFANGGQHVLPPPPLVAPSIAASLGRGSPSSSTMVVQSEEDETLLSFICDASVTLMECGAHCAGGSYPHPTRAQLRIAIPRPVDATSSHNSHHHAGGRTSGSKPIRIGSASTGGEASAATSTAASHFVDIEVINFWTFLAEGEAPRDAKATAAPPPTTLPLSSSVVVLPDVALTTCDAFIVVLDLSRYDTFAYCHQVLSKLHDIFNRDVSGADGRESSATAAAAATQTSQSSSSSNSRLVAAVIASTHRLVQPGGVCKDGSSQEGDISTQRCVSSEECRALGTQWGVPVFEVSLSPSDMLRHRKVLEKIISRVMHVRGAL